VLEWGDRRALKLFQGWVSREKAERELKVTQAVRAIGLPAPRAFELIEMKGRFGIVFERIEGVSLLRRVQRKPWLLFTAARQLAELHVQIHCFRPSPDMPPQREQILRWIDQAADLSPGQNRAARACLARLPEGDSVCHGDFHPDNILLTASGPVIIDWMTGTKGHGIADVTRTSQLFQTAKLPKDCGWHMRALLLVSRQLLHAIYLQNYCAAKKVSRAEIEEWRPAQIAAALAWKHAKMV
jgi:aminoglycoside phosphotransferase (APT) family kinase protein